MTSYSGVCSDCANAVHHFHSQGLRTVGHFDSLYRRLRTVPRDEQTIKTARSLRLLIFYFFFKIENSVGRRNEQENVVFSL